MPMAACRVASSSASIVLLSLGVMAGAIDCASVSPGNPSADASAVPNDLATPNLHDASAPPPDLAQPPDLAPAMVADMAQPALYQISVKATGQLLSVHNAATANGSIVEQQPALARADQRWQVRANGAGAFAIVNAQSGNCLEVAGASSADGATVQIWTCSGSSAQAWMMTDAGGGFYNVVNVNSRSCLDLNNSNSAPGTVIFQYHCNGGDNQKWLLTRVQ
jgi:hypothetical protein